MALILKDIGKVADALSSPVIAGAKIIGDVGSYAAGALTGNQQAQANATTAAVNATRQLTHNPVSNFVGNTVVKPLIQFPVDASNAIYNNAIAPTIGTPTFTPEQTPGIVGDIAHNVGATGSLHQLVGSGVQTALTIGSGGLGDAIEGLGAKAVPSLATTVFPRAAADAAVGAGFNAASAASQGETPGQIAVSGAEGAALGGALPLVKPTVKLVGRTVDNRIPLTEAGGINNAAVDSAASDTAKSTVSLKQAGEDAAQAAPVPATTPTEATATPAKPVVSPAIPPANTGIPEIDKAINDTASLYSQQNTFEGNAQDVVGQATGKSQIGSRSANQLRAALKNNLTKEENEAVDSVLDGEPNGDITPKVVQVANALRPLYDQAHGIREAITPSVGKVTDYSPRILINKLSSAVRDGSGNILGKIKSLADVQNTESGFSKNRQVGKFVSKDDVLYGNSSKIGLTKHQDGSITDSTGKVYKQVAVGKNELEENTNYKYEHKASTVAGVYHGDTLSLKVRGEAIQALADNPQAHGLYTKEQVASGEGPADATAVDKVTGLTDKDGSPLFASKSDAKELNDKLGYHNPSGLLGKTYDAASNVATQFIVLNPIFHGMNQLYQTAIAAGNLPGLGTGWIKLAEGVNSVTEDDIREYLDKGGHIPTYGSEVSNVLSRATGGVTKLNSKAMSAIETKLRVGLYKASLDKRMSSAEAIKNIDKFLGDSKAIDPTLRRITLFAHYFKTMSKALGSQVMHPRENIGSIGNAATMAAVTAAVSYGYAEATGNPNAHVRVPGELGLAQEAYDTAHGLLAGQGLPAAGLITNHINPVAKEVASQVLNKDLYTGQPIGNSVGAKLSHAANQVIAPVATGSKVAEGKRSLPEIGANQLGLNTPHAKGYQAAPKVSFLNTPKAIVSKTGDPTGYQQEQQYFNSLNKLKSSVSSDATGKSATGLAYYLARSHDPTTGQTIANSPAESIQNASFLYANDKVRNAVQTFEKSQAQHDPVWDLPASQLKIFQQYKAMYTGDADKTNILQNNPWIKDVENKENAFYSSLPPVPGSKGTEANAQTPTYPTFDPQTTALLAAYDNADTTDRTALLTNNEVPLSSAFNDIANWTNAMRKAEGAPALASYPEASSQVQAILNTYSALPKGNGSNGGSPDRAAWIQANPQAYAQMTNYLTSASVYGLIKNASEAQFAGSSPNQTLLKDIKEVGSNDIASTPGANGSTNYSINPSLAYTQNNDSSNQFANTVIASEKQATQNRDAEKIAKSAKYLTSKNYSKTGKGKVSLAKAKTFKVKMPKVGKIKVASIKTGHGISAKSTAPSTSGRKVALRV